MVASVVGLVPDVVSAGLLVVTSDSRVVWANRALFALVTGGAMVHEQSATPDPTGLGVLVQATAGFDDMVAARLAVAEAGLPLVGVVPDGEPCEARWQAPDGTTRWLEIRCRALAAGDTGRDRTVGTGGYVLYEIVDNTARHNEEDVAQLRQRWLRHVETIARTGIWEWDLVTNEVEWSDELLAMFGYPTDTYLDYDTYRSLMHPDDVSRIEGVLERAIAEVSPFEFTHRMYLADRVTECVLECHGDVLTDHAGTPIRIMGTAHDVTELIRVRRELIHLTTHDPLTGLRNRQAMTALLSERIAGIADIADIEPVERMTGIAIASNGMAPNGMARAGMAPKAPAQAGTLLLVDVDDFKDVNDMRGHAVGDAVMGALAQLLAKTLPGAVLGRLGGDEFAVVLESDNGPDGLGVANALCEKVARHTIIVDGVTIRITVSVGVVSLSSATDSDMALARAHLALYEAKDAGRGCARLFTPERYEHVARRISMVQRVRDALDGGLMALDAQPVVDLSSRQVQGYELLLRLRDGRQPDLAPAEFMGALADSDLMLSLDRWVLAQAVAALASATARRERLRLHMNISGQSVADPEFGQFVLSALRAARVDPSQLGLEIPESVAVTSLDAARHLAETLTDAGCRFTLDDFGASVGSFVYLRNLPFTNVKIDGDFLRHVDTSPADTVLVDAVVRVARCLGMYTIAEKVDREPLALALRDLGVDYAQGFLTGRPRPLTDLLAEGSDVDPETREVSLNGFLG
ncbi:putative bifunctional diguanylate cyclase/phosphodiesterase [Frankia sp. Cas4]|uniref:putative bifunctional diguanylate cyclase/phosphodiesterase n=1 Tax=Frankia sp. Cas4 TaxID=3073927 RepID=UPI002AD4B407|nr:EAL domain-containing protein [Frankia sp. Cas4]